MNLDEYGNALSSYTQSPEFNQLDSDQKQEMIGLLRQQYIDQNEDVDLDRLNSVTEGRNIEYLRGTGEGRVIPDRFIKENNIILPHQEPGYNALSKEKKAEKLEEFKLKIPGIAEQNPTQKNDTEFFLNESITQLERRNNGEGKGRIRSAAASIGEGFVAGLAEGVGATETAQSIRAYFQENPEYDEDLTQQLAQGLGSAGASIAIIAGLALTTKGLGGSSALAGEVGTYGSLASNGIMRYNEGYKKAIDAGLDEISAVDAGMASTPAAVIDVMSDKILASKLMPKEVNEVFRSGSVPAKRQMLGRLIAENGTRGKLVDYATSALGEGLAESAGDYAAGYGAYLATGQESFIPTDSESGRSFLIGAILGASIPAAIDIPQYAGRSKGFATKDEATLSGTQANLESIDPAAQQSVYDLLSSGRYKEALKLSETLMVGRQEADEAAATQAPAVDAPVTQSAEVTVTSENNITDVGSLPPIPASGTVEISETSTLPEIPASGTIEMQRSAELAPMPNSPSAFPSMPTQQEFTAESAVSPLTSLPPLRVEPTIVQRMQSFVDKLITGVKPGESLPAIPAMNPTAIQSIRNWFNGLKSTVQQVEQRNLSELPAQGDTSIAPAPAPSLPAIPAQGENNITEEPSSPIPSMPVPESDGIPPLPSQPVLDQISPEPIPELPSGLDSAAVQRIDDWITSLEQQSVLPVTSMPIAGSSDAAPAPVIVPIPVDDRSATVTQAQEAANAAMNEVIKTLPTIRTQEKFPKQPLPVPFATTPAADYLRDFSLNFTGVERSIVDAIIVDVANKNPSLVIVDNVRTPQKYSGFYSPKDNVIIIEDKTFETVAHEVVHALTVADIDKFAPTKTKTYAKDLRRALGKKETPQHIKNLISVYFHAAEVAGFSGTIGQIVTTQNVQDFMFMSKAEYAFTDIKEFIAAAMSSQSFQETLANIPYEGSTVWKKIVEAIADGLSWIRTMGSPDLILRSDGENALVATLASAREIINGGQNNINETGASFLPRLQDIDDSYVRDLRAGQTDEQLQHYIDEAAKLNGFSLKPYYRGDEIEWTEGDRPTYLTDDASLATLFSGNGIPMRKFYVKEDLKIAKVGDAIGRARLTTSSYIGNMAQMIEDGIYEPRINAESILNAGYDAVEGTIDGGNQTELVVIDTRNIKLANSVTYDNEHMPILPSKRFDTTKNNINFLPAQTRSQALIRSYARLNDIQNSALSDKYDGRTQEIIGILSKIRNSDVAKMPNQLQDYFFVMVDNIFESRKSAIENPQMRVDSNLMIQQLGIIKKAIDTSTIANILVSYDGLIDFDSLQIDLTDVDAVKAAVNDYMQRNDVEELAAKQAKNEKARARRQKIYQNWRDEYNGIRTLLANRYANADNFAAEYDATNGTIIDENLKTFLKAHFDYLNGVDVSALEGKALYKHFFAINNLNDGNIIGLDVTIANIAKMRDANEDINSLANTFRDPAVTSGSLRQALDKYNSFAEIHQVALQRASSYEGTRQWLQEKFLGNLYDAIVRTTNNRKKEYIDEYIAYRKQVEENLGRELNTEDRVMISIFGRLAQFEQGTSPDAALLRNIKKERKSIHNIIATGSKENRRLFNARVSGLFESAVEGLESYGDGSMQQFMDTMDQRMAGTEPNAVGVSRRMLLEKSQEIFSRFNSESRMISEGFYNKPFKQQVNYISNDVSTTDVESIGRDIDMTDTILSMNEQSRDPGIKQQAAHYYERQGDIGDSDYYSYNSENILARNVERIAVDNGTIAERFVIKERLKNGSDLNNIISLDRNGEKHPNRISAIENQVIRIVKNAVGSGPAPDFGLQVMRAATSVFARPVLSSPHHIVTQPIAAAVDYGIRTNNIIGWLKAASYYAMNSSFVDEWFNQNQRWTGDRSALEAQAIDQRRSPTDDEEKRFLNHPAIKTLSKIYDKVGQIMTIGLHIGDNYSTKVTILAEYMRLLQEKGYQVENLSDVDFGTVEGKILTQATLNAEKNVNTSNKVLRGDLFTDRRASTTVIRNLLFAFSAHSASLSTQMQQAIRDLSELKSLGAPTSEMTAKARTITAITTQQVAFTSARFLLGGLSAKLMIGLISDLFDDEEGKIAELQEQVYIAQKKGDPAKIAHAEQELANAKVVRGVIDKMKQSTQTSGSWMKQVLRDGTGAFHIAFNNGAAQQVAFLIPDAWMGASSREGQEAAEKDLKAQVKAAKDKGRFKEAAKLSEQLVTLSNVEYIPFAYPVTNSFGLGGLYGSVLDSGKRTAEETNGAIMGAQEYSWNDMALTAATLGIGQSEMTKTLRAIDKIENEFYDSNKKFQESKLPAAEARKKKKNKIIF